MSDLMVRQQLLDACDRIERPQDAIEILCQLQAHLSRSDHYAHVADCFCGARDDWVEQGVWRNSGVRIRKIIEASLPATPEENL